MKVYAANRYFDGGLYVSTDGHPDYRFGVSYADYTYTGSGECVTYGFSIFRNNKNTHLCATHGVDKSEPIDPLWGTWFDEELIYDPVTGGVKYAVNGDTKIKYNVGPMPGGAETIQLSIGVWGWWTGHYQHLEDIAVFQ